jgi:hypothetical protein
MLSLAWATHKLIRTIYFVLARRKPYRDSTFDYEAASVAKNAPRWIRALKKYGYWPKASAGSTEAAAAATWSIPSSASPAAVSREHGSEFGADHLPPNGAGDFTRIDAAVIILQWAGGFHARSSPSRTILRSRKRRATNQNRIPCQIRQLGDPPRPQEDDHRPGAQKIAHDGVAIAGLAALALACGLVVAGHSAAQDTSRDGEPKRCILSPISIRIMAAAISSMPGMVWSRRPAQA